MDLGPTHFPAFFRAVHGHEPFPWQVQLLDRLAQTDGWPDVLDLPTGAGKTAALDAAVFHLALRATSPALRRKAALRIVFVVDRRLVVDDAYARAEKIACALKAEAPLPEVLEVARRLRDLAGAGAPPLIARRLRGGVPLDRDWTRTPTQPMVLCSTVDQVGSRLLFRGYGVSDRMKPVHAGLLGTDTLLLLDEVHLSEPFRQTLSALRSVGSVDLRAVVLSATPGHNARDALSLSRADRSHPVLKRRLRASRVADLNRPVSGSIGEVARRFCEAARMIMERLRDADVPAPAVGIVVNRVALARAVFEGLVHDLPVDCTLLIGRSRGAGRDRLVEKLGPFRTADPRRSSARPLFVVATQCLEVGVDLDLDGLVTQAAPLDALRQRFGRLNRDGRPVRARGAVIPLADDVAKKADDVVYADRTRLTWEALNERAREGVLDFGIEALGRALRKRGLDENEFGAPRADAPVLMPAYLALWAQTSPRPVPDPDVTLFLHGPDRVGAGVSIVWRVDLLQADLEDGLASEIEHRLRLVPPLAAEVVEVPLAAAREWLFRGAGSSSEEIADVPARSVPGNRAYTPRARGRAAFRWAGVGERTTGIVHASDLRPGDLVVVPAGYGGCDAFGWAPDSSAPVFDVADESAKPYWGRRCAVRITPDVVTESVDWVLVSALLADETLSPVDIVDSLLASLPARSLDEEDSRDVKEFLEALRGSKGQIEIHFPYGTDRGRGAVLVAERGTGLDAPVHSPLPATESDHLSVTSVRAVPLDEHGGTVGDFAERFARQLGLGPELARDLWLAGFLHDAGKADPRFQTMLAGGGLWNRPDGPVLAKSARPWSRASWERSGLPEGWRHEALSVRMARVHPRLRDAADPHLVLWLVGTHHGLGRPFFAFRDSGAPRGPFPCLGNDSWSLAEECPGPESLAFDFEGSDWASLFEDLKARYGIWGLAYLEAILRLADHRASEQERAS